VLTQRRRAVASVTLTNAAARLPLPGRLAARERRAAAGSVVAADGVTLTIAAVR